MSETEIPPGIEIGMSVMFSFTEPLYVSLSNLGGLSLTSLTVMVNGFVVFVRLLLGSLVFSVACYKYKTVNIPL
jgi:hypothetical protein